MNSVSIRGAFQEPSQPELGSSSRIGVQRSLRKRSVRISTAAWPSNARSAYWTGRPRRPRACARAESVPTSARAPYSRWNRQASSSAARAESTARATPRSNAARAPERSPGASHGARRMAGSRKGGSGRWNDATYPGDAAGSCASAVAGTPSSAARRRRQAPRQARARRGSRAGRLDCGRDKAGNIHVRGTPYNRVS